ncbi:MAG: hypothetical protein MPK06_00285 [Alphaproteobacteria bacterium]|nr:hypothetical protein [Alphaproteobacteria bacterium]MDA8004086.1 hypothetical protein [Alphaproteobacteria bacterium]MDA8004980.1 hypothetical protein [Alphaproteobacteria bacterium]MDA8012967.1 hypothetical protein [Alphaproteobacteria bacterium]
MPVSVGDRLVDALGIPPNHYKDYSVHLAIRGSQAHRGTAAPYDVFRRSRYQWQAWNENAPNTGVGRRFTKKYILSLARYDPAGKNDIWIYCCAYKVLAAWMEPYKKGSRTYQRWYYEVASIDLGKNYSGRLVVEAKSPGHHSHVRHNLTTGLSNQLKITDVFRTPKQNWSW